MMTRVLQTLCVCVVVVLCALPHGRQVPDLNQAVVSDGEQFLLRLVHVHVDDAVLGIVEGRQRWSTANGKRLGLYVHRASIVTYATFFSVVWHGSQTRTSNSKPMIGMLMRFTEHVSQIALPQWRQ